MKEKLKHYAKEIAIFVIVMTVLANIVSLYKSSDLNKKPFNLQNLTLIDGSKYKFNTEKPILVHFWATWCPTCKVEASNIQRLSESYEVITIAVKSGSDEDIKKYLKENDYDFNVLNDYDGFISSTFNVPAFPTTFIYDKNRNLVFSEVGYTSTWGLWLRMWWSSF